MFVVWEDFGKLVSELTRRTKMIGADGNGSK